MNIRKLNEDTYELLNDAGEQIKQASITQEMRDAAKARRMGLERYIGAVVEKVRVEAPISATSVEEGVVVVVPDHEHEFDARYADKDHTHDDKASKVHAHDYADKDHGHAEFGIFKDAIERESQERFKADQQLEERLNSQRLADKSELIHAIDDGNSSASASLSTLRKVVASIEASIPTGIVTQADLNPYAEALNMLRSEVTSLRGMITGLESKAQDSLDKAVALLRSEMQDIQPKGDYVTRDELAKPRKAEYVLLSTQDVGGKTRLIMEDA